MSSTDSLRKHATTSNSSLTQPETIDPLFNAAFIRIFGQNDSKRLTRSLVNAVLRRALIEPIGDIEVIDAEHTTVLGSVNCKTPRIDVRIISANRIIDIEAQNYPQDIGNRSIMYGAELLTAETVKSTDYVDLPQAIVITLLNDEPLFPESAEFINVCRMHWEEPGGIQLQQGPDRILLVLVELSKIRERYTVADTDVLADEAVAWAYLLTNGFSNKQDVEAIMETFPDISEFAEKYGLAANDPVVIRAYRDAISAEREYNSRQRYLARKEKEAEEIGLAKGLEEGLEEGLEKGLEEGRLAERNRIVRLLRDRGADEALIEACLEEKPGSDRA